MNGRRSAGEPVGKGERPSSSAPAPHVDTRLRRVCVCILNWNGWRDTVECLESVLRIPAPSMQVVVLDNGSTDGSLARLRGWANGTMTDLASGTPAGLQHLVRPPLAKPIPFHEHCRESLQRLGPADASDVPLLLVRNEANLGYAGGLNVGLRYVLRARIFDHVWLLNNDTVVEPASLARLVERMEADPRLGLCGSTLLFYDEPDRVQALGGFRYNVWLGLATQIGQMRRYSELSREDTEAAKIVMFGVQGASVLVSLSFLERVGLLAEDYFLYFEEQDWAARARRSGFDIGYAPKSVVYHKEGRSTGNNSRSRQTRSPASDYYQIQARLLFTRKFYPYALPTVYLGLLGVLLNRIRRRQFRRAWVLARLALRMIAFPHAHRLDGVPPAGAPAAHPRSAGNR